MDKSLKVRAIELRLQGFMYSEIQEQLGTRLAKSTLSSWFQGLRLSDKSQEILTAKQGKALASSQPKAVAANRRRRSLYFSQLRRDNSYLLPLSNNPGVAKIILAILYLAEGQKNFSLCRVRFCNTDPKVITLFLKLLRKCYTIDSAKLHCTVQYRADQNIRDLEQFWSKATKIPLDQFTRSKVDPRTIGKPTLKPNYKGVCVVTYSSSVIFHDLFIAAQAIMGH
jgi:hypothetical protein